VKKIFASLLTEPNFLQKQVNKIVQLPQEGKG